MARRRRRHDDLAVSLFPFLSVLACVIGTLTLLLAALAIQRMGGPSLARIRLAEQIASLGEAIAGGEAHLVEIEAQLHRADQEARDGEVLGRRLAALGLSLEISLEDLVGLTDLMQESVDLEKRKKTLEQKRKLLVEKAAERETEIVERKRAQVRAPIIIDPSGLGRDWRPYLIECTAEFIELHRSSGDFSVRIPRAEIQRSEDFRRFLRRARVIHDSIIIFLIRPDGVETYHDARLVTDRHHVRNAKLPLPGDGELDFSQLSGRS